MLDSVLNWKLLSLFFFFFKWNRSRTFFFFFSSVLFWLFNWRKVGLALWHNDIDAVSCLCLQDGFVMSLIHFCVYHMKYLKATFFYCFCPCLTLQICWNSKMLDAIFQILKDEDSLSLIIESYQLLNELDKVLSNILVSPSFSAWLID